MIKGVIFDMDGVISDTQKLHSQVESELLGRFGIAISPEEITKQYAGVRTKEFFDTLLRAQTNTYDLDKLMQEKWGRMQELATISVDSIAGATDLIQRLFANGLPMAVASASNLNYVEAVLNTIGVHQYFKTIISGDMVSKGKPHPESFLLAAEKINIDPKDCLVIEDGVSGMEAARVAGMKCIGLVYDKGRTFPTSNLVGRLDEITEEYLNNLA